MDYLQIKQDQNKAPDLWIWQGQQKRQTGLEQRREEQQTALLSAWEPGKATAAWQRSAVQCCGEGAALWKRHSMSSPWCHGTPRHDAGF